MNTENRAGGPSADDDRLARQRELGRRITRFFGVFTTVQGAAFVLVAMAMYVWQIVGFETGVLLMGVVALIGSTVLVVRIRGFLREREEIART